MGVTEALHTATSWLTPAQLRGICVGGSPSDVATQAGDEAWAWVKRYLDNHGPSGRPKAGGRIGTNPVTGEMIVAAALMAPDVPPYIDRILILMGGDRIGGLKRIDLSSNTEQPFIKKEFIAAFIRSGRMA